MIRDGEHAELMGRAEALLFVSDEPVATSKLAEMCGARAVDMEEALALLAAEYDDERRGMRLAEVAGGWRFLTAPEHHDLIERYVISWDTRRLSEAALEALAVVAYHQPVTRSEVASVRGVNSDGVISSLVEKGLVRERGRDSSSGAILYGTTRAFLERFGLSGIDELPPLADFAPDEETRALIAERLGRAGGSAADALGGDDDVMLTLTREGHVAGEVDFGDAERTDDPEAMAAIIAEAATEKAPAPDDEIETVD